MISKEMPAENQVNHQEFEHRTKRIVSNYFMLFLRIFFITIINLYSVKYVFENIIKLKQLIYQILNLNVFMVLK